MHFINFRYIKMRAILLSHDKPNLGRKSKHTFGGIPLISMVPPITPKLPLVGSDWWRFEPPWSSL